MIGCLFAEGQEVCGVFQVPYVIFQGSSACVVRCLANIEIHIFDMVGIIVVGMIRIRVGGLLSSMRWCGQPGYLFLHVKVDFGYVLRTFW